MSRPFTNYQSNYLSTTAIRFWWPVSRIILFLITANVVVFAITSYSPLVSNEEFFRQFAILPQRLLADSAESDRLSILLTFVSHAFLHSDLLHLGLNMFWLYVFGQSLAIRFGADAGKELSAELSGVIVFMSFYLSAAVFSGLVFALINLNQQVLLIGASGAISAITAGALRVTLRRYQPHGLGSGNALSVFDWKILLMTIFYVGSNLLLLTPYGAQQVFGRDPSQIAWEAHVGGFLYGLVMFSFFDRLTTKR